jgi:hypothetical protein
MTKLKEREVAITDVSDNDKRGWKYDNSIKAWFLTIFVP